MAIVRGEKRATGVEPATFSLEGSEHQTEAPQNKGLAGDAARACTAACTDDAESLHDNAGGTFAEALAMIARLPLSDADKADAVRRLLAQSNG